MLLRASRSSTADVDECSAKLISELRLLPFLRSSSGKALETRISGRGGSSNNVSISRSLLGLPLLVDLGCARGCGWVPVKVWSLWISMGQALGSILQNIFPVESPRNLRLLMLGLDAAGKTTILYKLKVGETVATIPTIGFNVEHLQHEDNVSFTVWDVGGQSKIRQLWCHYFHDAQGLIFVVDSTDQGRMKEAQEELHRLMDDPMLTEVKVLVLANKCDLPNSMPLEEISGKLGLSKLRQEYSIQSCCAISGEGLFQGLDWLATVLKEIPTSSPWVQ
ncbi:hypothetical protein R1sor_013519 [Riccia sorocarpa]|uniref:ADP-ribosylation factor n=1 Tax=Riccia sorocarpa TaxID=122646 RepID=A0ABD3H6T2_9MARC